MFRSWSNWAQLCSNSSSSNARAFFVAQVTGIEPHSLRIFVAVEESAQRRCGRAVFCFLLRPETLRPAQVFLVFARIVAELWLCRLVSASCTLPPLPLKSFLLSLWYQKRISILAISLRSISFDWELCRLLFLLGGMLGNDSNQR